MEHAVDDERMHVKVEVERRAAAMDRHHCSAARRAVVGMRAQPRKDGAHEGPDDGGLAPMITREFEALRRR